MKRWLAALTTPLAGAKSFAGAKSLAGEKLSGYLFVAGLLLLLTLLQLFQDDLLPQLRLELAQGLLQSETQGTNHRVDVRFCQPWRLFTAHWLHANWSHFLLNIGSLIAALSLFPEMTRLSRLLPPLLLCPIAVSLGLVLFDTSNQWYIGYSGAFYGLLTCAAVQLFGRNPFAPFVLLFVIAKIGWEQTLGPLQSSSELMPGQIAIQAHLYGAICGVPLGLLSRFILAKSSSEA
ncbi:rhombosortase [Corallincola platygyrae]|uniref:Rhombosortase n=1 Tax=Corallincola platygyrae TaxID=1193278 RepID=A0ABW4XNV9_9GAMM